MAETIEMSRQKLSEYGVELEDGIATLRVTARCVPGYGGDGQMADENGADETLDGPAARSFVYGSRSKKPKGGWGFYCGGLLGALRSCGCLTDACHVANSRYRDEGYETQEEAGPIALNGSAAEPAAVAEGIEFEMEEPGPQDGPESAPEIPVMGFSFDFAAVERVVVDEDNPYFCAQDGVLFNKDMTRLIWYPYGKQEETYIVPAGVKEIGPWAFAGTAYTYLVKREDGSVVEGRHHAKYVFNKSLRRVILSGTVEVIWDHAFNHCIFLESVDLARVRQIQWDAFRGCKELRTLDLPDSLEFVAPAFQSCSNLKTVRFLGVRRQLRSWVTYSSAWNAQYAGPVPYSPPFMEYLFGWHPYKKNLLGQYVKDMGVTHMPEIYADHPQFILEDGVMFSLGRTELIWCSHDKFGHGRIVRDSFPTRWEPGEHSVYTVPATVARIGDRAFEKCVGLTQVVISHPDTVIGNRAFFGCEHLEQVVFQNSGSVKHIGDSAFHCCGELREPPLTGVEHIGELAFYGCTSLGAAITVPESCRRLGEKAFDQCSHLKSLRIPKALPPYSFTYGAVNDLRSKAADRY